MASLANKEGMSIHILSWLKTRPLFLLALQTDFIGAGWEHAKTKGALEDAPLDGEGESGQPEAAPELAKPSAALPLPVATLSLEDATTPPTKRARVVASPIGPSESSGVLAI